MTDIINAHAKLYSSINQIGIKYNLVNDIIKLIFNYNEYQFNINEKDLTYLILNSKKIKFIFDKNYNIITINNFIHNIKNSNNLFNLTLLMSLLPNTKLEELIIEGYSQYAAIFEDFIGIPKSLKKLQAPHFYTMDIETYKYQLDNLTILIDDLCNKKILNNWQSGNLGDIPWYRSSSIYNICYYIANNKINIIKDTDSHIEYNYIFEDI